MKFETPIREVIAAVSAQASWMDRNRLAVFENHEIPLTCTSECELGETVYTLHAEVGGVKVNSRLFTFETLNMDLFMDLWDRVRQEINREEHARRASLRSN